MCQNQSTPLVNTAAVKTAGREMISSAVHPKVLMALATSLIIPLFRMLARRKPRPRIKRLPNPAYSAQQGTSRQKEGIKKAETRKATGQKPVRAMGTGRSRRTPMFVQVSAKGGFHNGQN